MLHCLVRAYMKEPETVYLALGSNLGKREENLRSAQNHLGEILTVRRASSIYLTPPWGVTDQPAFLNQVLETSCGLEPLELLKVVKNIEVNMGRIPAFRYGPRLIDIDILLYGQRQIRTPELTIPHPQMAQRAFVLVPLNELAPDLLLPGETPARVRDLLAKLDSSGILPYTEQYA